MGGVNKFKFKIIYFRWASVILISLLFVISYKLDIQMLEGSLIGSRFMGFHLTDPFATFEVIVAHGTLPINLLIGAASITFFYIIMGGRIFCSWVCPYGLLSEIGEYFHLKLVERGVIKGGRSIPVNGFLFWAVWLVLSFATGYLIFETFNVMAITSRFLIYGFSFSLIFVLLVLLVEIFFSRRVWCVSICPVGKTYGAINYISAGRITWEGNCGKCGKCFEVCYDKKLLDFINKADVPASKPLYVKGAGCTLCGKCIDVCPQGCMSYRNRLKNIV